MTEHPTALQIVEGIDLSGKTCVITGASSGLGRESARALAAGGAHVILAARNPDALAETARWIASEVPAARTSTVSLELTDLSSVRAAASAVAGITPVVDVLMNNAGVMFTPFGRTRDGFELQIGTNHFGHFELTRLLIPQLTAAGAARVVILSSGGHVMGDVDVDDPNWERREYDKFAAYGASKTACFLDFVMPEHGAATQVWAAVSPDLAGRGGDYLEDCGIGEAAPHARDERRAAQLWELSERLCAAR